jgi:uncharacterized protein (DUF2147 family)
MSKLLRLEINQHWRFLLVLFCLMLTSGAPAVAQQPPGAARPSPGASGIAPPPGQPAAPPSPIGVWIDHTGRGAVEILSCGVALCGRIVWMQQPNDRTGKPLRDQLNEDRSKRNRQICGLQVIGGLQAMRDGSWDRGWIYDPEQGESFDVEIRLRSADVLQVKGYKGLKFLSETFNWRRATEPLAPACPAPQPA